MEDNVIAKLQKALVGEGALYQPTIVTRGFIIDWSINIDHLISLILAYYYGKKDRLDSFVDQFLLDEYCTFGFKIKVFLKTGLHEKTENSKKLVEYLHRIMEIRNIVAHSISLPHLGKETIFYSKQCKPAEINELHKEFLKKYTYVLPILDRIFGELVDQSQRSESETHPE